MAAIPKRPVVASIGRQVAKTGTKTRVPKNRVIDGHRLELKPIVDESIRACSQTALSFNDFGLCPKWPIRRA